MTLANLKKSTFDGKMANIMTLGRPVTYDRREFNKIVHCRLTTRCISLSTSLAPWWDSSIVWTARWSSSQWDNRLISYLGGLHWFWDVNHSDIVSFWPLIARVFFFILEVPRYVNTFGLANRLRLYVVWRTCFL